MAGVGKELVVLVFELQFDVLGRGVASATKVKAPACSAFGLRFIAPDTTFFARHTAGGAPTIDHDCDSDDARNRDLIAMDYWG